MTKLSLKNPFPNIYCVIFSSGHQYILTKNTWVDIKIPQILPKNSIITFTKILFYKGDKYIQIGKPFLSNSIVYGIILDKLKSPKICVLKTRPKKHYTRKKGFRNSISRILII